ncbi:MAG: hypothetical protein PHD96_00945 [Candidatus Pacebacteria bacterium]|nr:hypothetical protein [Candidatus Paceibacterota bacterium]
MYLGLIIIGLILFLTWLLLAFWVINVAEQVLENISLKKTNQSASLKRYLFICAQNKTRSPTAEQYFRKLLEKRHIQAEVQSAGVLASSYRVIDEALLDKADKVFVMDDNCLEILFRKFPQMREKSDKIINLEILDCYDRTTHKFSEEYFERIVIKKIQRRFKNEPQKAAEIEQNYRNRPEIKNRWSLEQVLDNRFLDKYI